MTDPEKRKQVVSMRMIPERRNSYHKWYWQESVGFSKRCAGSPIALFLDTGLY